MTSLQNRVLLELAAQLVADATAAPPFTYQLNPDAARKRLVELQSGRIPKAPVDEQWVTIPAAGNDVRLRLVRPSGRTGILPVVLYLHGGGWMLGDARTHDRLIRLLATGADAAIAFVEYDRSPEARYPVALEQGYAAARWLTDRGDTVGIDAARMAVAGDSAGGNLAAAMAILASERRDVRFVQQSLYYPVTDAAMDTGSFRDFANGYYLSDKTMQWFWDQYTTSSAQRAEITASPNRASIDRLRGLPPAFVVVAEADVLRDEGEAYAAKLRAAGVAVTTVRYDGAIHDFMMLDSLRATAAARAAVAQASAVLRAALNPAHP